MTRPVVHIDFETRSAVDLKKAGLYRYAEDPSTEILCLSYRVDDGPIQRWDGASRLPVADNALIVAHNAAFERQIWNEKLSGYAPLLPENQDCTMARANALNLPASLDGIGAALAFKAKKDDSGHSLMRRMCKAGYVDKPGDMAALMAYCDQDVATECEADTVLPPLDDFERRVWVLDQKINDRGFAVDMQLVDRAQACVNAAQVEADREISVLTGGAIAKTAQTVSLVKWMNGQGVPCESVSVGEYDEIITRCELFATPHVARALDVRQASTKAFKFKAAQAAVCADGRIKGTLAYNNAISGRWTGRLFQPHNMKRIETEEDEQIVQDALWILEQPMSPQGHLEALKMLCGEPLEALSLLSRATIVAGPGKVFYGGDFSNIEGRLNAWINGEAWKVAAFREFDNGTGPDLYRVMAGSILGKPVQDISKDDRQLWGKVPELACGYQGGVNAFHKMGANYGLRVADSLAKSVVNGFREANPRIAAGWKELQEGAILAVNNPGLIVPCLQGKVSYRMFNGVLWCQVPSGGVIPYPGARLRPMHKVVVIDGEEIEFDNWGVSFPNPKAPKTWVDLYGGRQMAHVVSRTARDILASAMLRLEDEGYPLVLTVHDETLSEVDAGFGSVEEYQRILEIREPWFEDLPVTAKGWTDVRYVK